MMATRIGGWKPLLDRVESKDGRFVAMELCSAQALHEEGQAMRHCVGSYASRCSSGDSAIFSVLEKRSDGTMSRLGTFEMGRRRRDGGGSSWEYFQFRGKCNATVASGGGFVGELVDLAVERQACLDEEARRAAELKKRELDGLKAAAGGVVDMSGSLGCGEGSRSMRMLGGR